MIEIYLQLDWLALGDNLLDIWQAAEVWFQIETDTGRGALQGDGSDQQDDQHHVGEGGGDVNYLEKINSDQYLFLTFILDILKIHLPSR